MIKNKINLIIDSLSLFIFLIVAETGLVIFFFLPEGMQRGGYQEFWGISKRTYVNIHDWSGIILIILVIIHLILHWRWIIATVKILFKKQQPQLKRDGEPV